MSKFIAWFRDITKEDIPLVGGKGANLGEMYTARLPIPPGFIVTAPAFKYVINVTGLRDVINTKLKNLNIHNTEELQRVAKEIQELILQAPVPSDLQEAIKEAYDDLNVGSDLQKHLPDALSIIKVGRDMPFVAVRSSATAEDLPSASFAGQQASFMNIKGNKQLIETVRECWSSLYTARAIYYREKNNFPHDKVLIAVVVQRMVQSESAGVLFTINPATNNKDELVIEGAFGLGDAVVGGEVTPDNYIIDKKSLTCIKKKIGKQEWFYTKESNTGKTYKKELTEEKGTRQKVTDEHIEKLARLGKAIEEHYHKPMDIEWAIEGPKVFIVQARPITTIKEYIPEEPETITLENNNVLLEGLAASPGNASGPVKIVHDMAALSNVKSGDILVAKMTSPDYVQAMERAVAIVTDEGGLTSHASIVSREMGIPCVVGTEQATTLLKDNQIITVDGTHGKVYDGKREIEKYKELFFDGIGLMRIEFIITSYVKKHPMAMLANGTQQIYIETLAKGIAKVAEVLKERPLIVRFSDFKTNEYKNLEGGEHYEPHEENPMIGWRGVSRYIHKEFTEAFKLECQAIVTVREKHKNVHVMLPFVRNINEVKQCLGIMAGFGLMNNEKFNIYLMAEVPSVAFIPEQFASLPITGASIGSNDLTQLVLGVDRDSARLGKMGYFDERNDAVKEAIKRIIHGFQSKGKTVGICGQAPTTYPEFCDFLVKEGINSISVNPDAVIRTRQNVAKCEKNL